MRCKKETNPSGSVTIRRITGALAAYAVAFAASAGVCSADMMRNTNIPFWYYVEVVYVIYSIAIPITLFLVIANIFLLFSKDYRNYSLGGRILGLFALLVGFLTLFMVIGVFFYVIAIQVMADYNPWKAKAERKERKLNPPEDSEVVRERMIQENEDLLRRMEKFEEDGKDEL